MSALAQSGIARLTARSLATSTFARWWRSSPADTNLFTESYTLKVLRKSQWLGVTAVGLGALGIATLLPYLMWPAAAVLVTVLFGYGFPKIACSTLPILLVWSPKFAVAISSGEEVFIRFDHGLVLGLVLALCTRREFAFRDTPIVAPLVLLWCVSALGIVAGLIRGTVPAPELSLLYLGQWVHLGLIFLLTYSLGPRLGPWAVRAWCLAVVSAGAYGIAEHLLPYESLVGGNYRTFERYLFDGQANHFAGLFAFATCVGLGMTASPPWRGLGLGLVAVSLTALIGTQSREGYVALAIGVGAFACLRWPSIAVVALPSGLLALLYLPSGVWADIFAPGSSMFARLAAWKSSLSTIASYPVLGLGVGARHRSFYDNQYLMVLAEQGAAGLSLFLLWLAYLGRALAERVRRDATTHAQRSLCWGVLAGLAAISIQSLAASCFIVTVIAGPLYWMAGYALSLDRED